MATTIEREVNAITNALRYEVADAIADDVRSRVLALIERARKEESDAFQQQVGEWADATFPRSRPDSIIAHLSDEVEELADLTIPDAFEAADCFLLLLHLAHKEGWSLMQTAREKFAINQQRQWGKADARGVVKHVTEAEAE